MTQGVVVGGWEYVWAAYGLSLAVFLGYGVMLITKLREELSRAQRDEEGR
jgi:heme exporter protein D